MCFDKKTPPVVTSMRYIHCTTFLPHIVARRALCATLPSGCLTGFAPATCRSVSRGVEPSLLSDESRRVSDTPPHHHRQEKSAAGDSLEGGRLRMKLAALRLQSRSLSENTIPKTRSIINPKPTFLPSAYHLLCFQPEQNPIPHLVLIPSPDQ